MKKHVYSIFLKTKTEACLFHSEGRKITAQSDTKLPKLSHLFMKGKQIKEADIKMLILTFRQKWMAKLHKRDFMPGSI